MKKSPARFTCIFSNEKTLKALAYAIAREIITLQSEKSKGDREEVAIGPLVIDALSCIAAVHGKQLSLTSQQFRLLFVLARHAGKLMTRDLLARTAWDRPTGRRAVDIQISRLRAKLDDALAASEDRIEILCVRKSGYQLLAKASVSQKNCECI